MDTRIVKLCRLHELSDKLNRLTWIVKLFNKIVFTKILLFIIYLRRKYRYWISLFYPPDCRSR